MALIKSLLTEMLQGLNSSLLTKLIGVLALRLQNKLFTRWRYQKSLLTEKLQDLNSSLLTKFLGVLEGAGFAGTHLCAPVTK